MTVPHGLHARPSALIVQAVRRLDAGVELRNRTVGTGFVSAGSLSKVATLGALQGHEIEIRAAGSSWDGTHVGVRERRIGSAPVWAAFFGSLTAGRYELRIRDHDSPTVAVEVRGGGVAEARW